MNKNEFTEYLEGKGLAPRTQKEYLSSAELFFAWAKKEDLQVTKPDVLRYLEYLKNKGLQNISRRNQLIALNHYFSFLYQSEQITANPCLLLKIRGANKKTLFKIYTPEELDVLFDNYYQLFVRGYDYSHQKQEKQIQYLKLNRERNAVILSVLANQGIITREIKGIEMGDLDLTKATIKIRGEKRLNDRTLPLKASQMGLLINYLQNIRPQLTEYQTKESEKLFLPLPAKKYETTDYDIGRGVIGSLTTQIKSIDKQFINFQHVRASVIAYWIKTQGLRKAQHFAGHRNISTTERYLANNLDDLTDDINKLHPF